MKMINSTIRRLATIFVYCCLSTSPHFLQGQPLSIPTGVLSMQTATMSQFSGPEKQFSRGWSFGSELGTHFKTLDFSNEDIKLPWGHDKRFWGEFGGLIGLGFKYGKVSRRSGYLGYKLSWVFFYPDVRWVDKSDITLASIPFVGKLIRIATDKAGYWSMILVPMIHFDIGYVTENNILFAMGSAYVWGLSPSMTVPLADQWSLEVRSTVFLDRIFFGRGYHNFLFNVGVNYKF